MTEITNDQVPVDTFIENLISYLSGDEYEEMSIRSEQSDDSSVKTRLTEKVRRFNKNYDDYIG
jgi:hypothetical protein